MATALEARPSQPALPELPKIPETKEFEPNLKLMGRLALADQSSLNPEKNDIQIDHELNSVLPFINSVPLDANNPQSEQKVLSYRDYNIYQTFSDEKRSEYWQNVKKTDNTELTFEEKKDLWKKQVVKAIKSNTERVQELSNYFNEIEITDMNNFTDEKAQKLYDTYFSQEYKNERNNKEPYTGVKLFVKNILDSHTDKTTGEINIDALNKNMNNIKWIGQMFGIESAELFSQLIAAEGQIKKDKQAFVDKIITEQINNLDPAAKQILSELWKHKRGLGPAVRYEREITSKMSTGKDTIVIGSPGVGKSSEAALMKQRTIKIDPATGKKPTYFITQPTQLTVNSNAERLQSLTDTVGKKLVGRWFKGRHDIDDSSRIIEIIEQSMINILTGTDDEDENSGRKIKADDIRYLNIDEVHKRSITTDMVLAFAKRLQKQRRDTGGSNLELYTTSATINMAKLRKVMSGDVELIDIKGESQEIEDHFFDNDYDMKSRDYIRNMSQFAAQRVDHIINTEKLGGNFMIFMPGQGEIEKTEEALNELKRQGRIDQSIQIVKYYSKLDEKEKKIIENLPKDKQIIYIVTNAAETGYTPDADHLIDSGIEKLAQFDNKTGVKSLNTVLSSIDALIQRRGRVGRKRKGHFWPLYKRSSLEKENENSEKSKDGTRLSYQTPEILRTDLTPWLLRLKGMGLTFKDLNPFLMDEIADNNEGLLYAQNVLKMLDATDASGTLTETGKDLNRLSIVDPRLARIVVEGKKVNKYDDACWVAAASSGEGLLRIPDDQRDDAKAKLQRFNSAGGSSDFVMLMNILKEYNQQKQINPRGCENWARDNYLHYKNLEDALSTYKQLKSKENKLLTKTTTTNGNIDDCIPTGFMDMLMISQNRERIDRRQNKPIKETVLTRQSTRFTNQPIGNATIAESSVLYGQDKEFIIGVQNSPSNLKFMPCQKVNKDWVQRHYPELKIS